MQKLDLISIIFKLKIGGNTMSDTNDILKYNTIPYGAMTLEEHNKKLKKIIATLLMYGDAETFVRIFKYEQDDYILSLFRELKIREMI